MAELEFKEIELSDKARFDRVLQTEKPQMSEYTFTNLFIWRKSRKVEFAEFQEGLIIKVEHEDQTAFYPPVGFGDPAPAFRVMREQSLPFRVERVPRYQIDRLISSGADRLYKIEDDRKNYDYIYATEKLAFLKGRKLDGKRGFIKSFTNKYEYHYLKYYPHMMDRCLKMAGAWINRKGEMGTEQLQGLLNEYEALNQLLDHHCELDYCGGVLCVGGNPAAMTFGEALNDDMFVVHFEKANTDYVGSYQMINQQFVQHEMFGKYAFVNREQDLGISGIRKAKMSYVPDRLLEKYTVTGA